MKKGKLVVIDGIDNSGKATQAKILANRLRKTGKKVKVIDFPRYYTNFFGRFIGECLAGKHGDFLSLDPHIASIIYAADRFESGQKISGWISDGCVVIADRYVSANQIHQGGKIADEEKRKEFFKWIGKMEYQVFKLPKPDVILYLDIPAKISQELGAVSGAGKKKRYLKGGKDAHEIDERHLKKARLSALGIVKADRGWKVINCVKNGEIMTTEEISDIIMEKLKSITKWPKKI